jgi:hypothetical protein
MNKPYYYRQNSYLYDIKSHPDYYFCTGYSDTIQALWGIIGEKIYLILFSRSGDLKTTKSFEAKEFISHFNSNLYDVLLEKVSHKFKNEYQLNEDLIRIKRFWISNLEVGIEDVTDNIKEFLLDPSEFQLDEQEDCKESFEEWKKEDQYVFWWEQSFYMGKYGDVESS